MKANLLFTHFSCYTIIDVNQAIFLSKRPDLLNIHTDLENAWFGVTVTRRSELWRLDALRKNVRAKYYHVTFEPLFDDPGEVDLTGIDWSCIASG